MNRTKYCPKCGSTNINPLVFYLPSIWRCLDCGYEGAFIIEGIMPAEEVQERYRKGCSITGWAEGVQRIVPWDGLISKGF